MPGVDLQQPFRLGDWLVDPRTRRLTRLAGGSAETRRLGTGAMAVLNCLAARHGTVVDTSELAAAIGASGDGAAARVDDAVDELRDAFGDEQSAGYVLSILDRGHSLIRAPQPAPESPSQPSPPEPVPDAQEVAREQAEATRGLLDMLRGNRLIQAALGYVVVSWLIVQVAANTFPALRVPLWGQTLVIVVLALLFPIAMVVVWARGPAGTQAAGGNAFARVVRRHWRTALVPIVLVVVVAVGFQWWHWMQTAGWTRAPTASIAVLPLVDLSPEGDSGYLGDGLSEELSSRLAQLPGLRVASRTSAFVYRGQDVDVRQIGSALGVRYVLEGSVRRDGDRVRVTAQLIDAESGYHAWTDNYDRDWRDLLTLQEDISRAIAGALRVVLTPEAEERLAKPATKDPKAYDLYLAGLASMRQSKTLQNLNIASEAFNKALAVDPAFARAFAGLCEAGVARYELTRAPDEMRAAEDACRKALETDAGLIETELALAGLYRASGRYDQAAIAYQGILDDNPDNADAHVGLGFALEGMQQLAAAERSLREAVSVEPGYWGTHNALGNFLFRHGRSAEAAQSYERVTELRPGNPTGFNNLGAAMLTTGDLAGAEKAFLDSARLEPNRSAYTNIGTTYYYQRRYADSVRMYEKATELAVQDHQVWGGLADALRRVPDRASESETNFRRAVMLAERSLGVNANDATTWAQLGYYYGRLKDAERAKRYLDRAAELGQSLPYVQLYLALAAADRNDNKAALDFLRRAVDLGYPAALIAAEPAFDGLHGDPRYKQLAATQS